MECEERGGVKIHCQVIKYLRFADDIDMLAKSEGDLQSQVISVHEDSKEIWTSDEQEKDQEKQTYKNCHVEFGAREERQRTP